MANGMGSLWVGTSGLQMSQSAMDVTANNIANVDTKGYVRQQTIFTDKTYLKLANDAAISKQTAGIGVTIGDVLHNRDLFIDKAYRVETGRNQFYTACYDATTELEDIFQEMDGESFQEILSSEDSSLWVAIQELAKDPSSSVNQNLLLQKASLFVTRSQAVYSSIKTYQSQLNTQIVDMVDRINEIGEEIYDLNLQIQKIEAGHIETASTLRDQRDVLLDELATYGSISYKELATGFVRVSFEGAEFINESEVNEMTIDYDKVTKNATPIWPFLGNEAVFDYTADISSENNTDLGKLKGLILARGVDWTGSGNWTTTYADLLYENANADTLVSLSASAYEDGIGMSVCQNGMAEFDTLVHGVVTGINDILCPNTTNTQNADATYTLADADGNVMYTMSDNGVIKDANGNTIFTLDAHTQDGVTTYSYTGKDYSGNTVTYYVKSLSDVQFLDTNTCCTGSDGNLPPQELFTRVTMDRYTVLTGADGNEYYIYNVEDVSDTSTMYTTMSLEINDTIEKDSSLIPYLAQNGEVDYDIAKALSAAFEEECLSLNPSTGGSWTYAQYYEQMIGELGTHGSVYKTTVENLDNTTASLETARSQVIGVSSDEELTKMIKYQNAFNAASRYINVVSEMIEHLVTNL